MRAESASRRFLTARSLATKARRARRRSGTRGRGRTRTRRRAHAHPLAPAVGHVALNGAREAGSVLRRTEAAGARWRWRGGDRAR